MQFVFHNPTKVYFGTDQLKNLPLELKHFGTRVLLVYGGGSIKKNGLYDEILKLCNENHLKIFELAGVEPNPRHTTVNRGVALCRKEHVDVILAVGGGSSIDCAKGIAATVHAATDNVWDLVEHKSEIKEALPLVTVLTLAATGSEMDTGAVISNMNLNVKSGLIHEKIRPQVSFEDPTVTSTVNAYQTASGSVDIITHILDVAYLSAQPQMEMLRNIQEEVMRSVIKFTRIALTTPDSFEARSNLMWASSWALNDFMYCGVAQSPILHAIEHELSAHYDITHGHGLAILTPPFLRYALNKDPQCASVIARWGQQCLGVTPRKNDLTTAQEAAKAVDKIYFDEFGLKRHLRDLNIDDSKFEIMAHACCNGLFAPDHKLHGLIDLDESDVVEILKLSL